MEGNAIIVKTTFGYESQGILSSFLILEQKGSSQAFGGFTLDDKPIERGGDRQPSIFAGFWIKRILETVGVENWENLKGKYVRVDGDYNRIFGIGHIIEDKWFYPEKEFKGLLNKEKDGKELS